MLWSSKFGSVWFHSPGTRLHQCAKYSDFQCPNTRQTLEVAFTLNLLLFSDSFGEENVKLYQYENGQGSTVHVHSSSYERIKHTRCPTVSSNSEKMGDVKFSRWNERHTNSGLIRVISQGVQRSVHRGDEQLPSPRQMSAGWINKTPMAGRTKSCQMGPLSPRMLGNTATPLYNTLQEVTPP